MSNAASGLAHLKPFLPGLEPLLEDAEVSEIMINGPGNVWIEARGRLTALARTRLAPIRFRPPIPPQGIFLAYQHRHQRIRPQLLMIVDIFIAQGQSINPLPHQLLHTELGEARIPPVPKAGGQAANEPIAALHLP